MNGTLDMELIENLWLELTSLPFLLIMTFALGFRFRVNAKINKRFFELILSTSVAAILEIISEFNPEHSIFKRIYYTAMTINAWCLIRYVSAYVMMIIRNFKLFNDILLYVCVLVPFFFKEGDNMFSMLNH